MPSAKHEATVDLVKHEPGMIAELLGLSFGVKVPPYAAARVEAADVSQLTPTSLRTDAIIVYEDEVGKAALAVVVEVQLGRNPAKRRTWPMYVTHVGLRHNCPTVLVVLCPNRRLAAWCRRPCETGHPDFVLRPLVLTSDLIPVITDPRLAAAAPGLAVLSAINHGDHANQSDIFGAVVAALASVDRQKAIFYYDIVLAGLSARARQSWEEYMNTAVAEEFRSEFMRDLAAKFREEGREEGRAEGEARTVLAVLAARGLDVPDEVRDDILSCTDLDRLDLLARRAATATSIEDLYTD
ncbi:MAG TPA: hypothetical protein VK028_09825 [Micromonosporaceae bacterium]|nr:hypothetical protein [Micromonosporaceae bacterium]